ncbi:MAG: hypothetical protein O9264_10035 [Leptospira sp.]|nr:hypothetical protein [Leptospira sp.]
MDHTVTLDMIGIHSGHIPAHINHPSFGLYFLLFIIQSFFYKLGVLTSINVFHLNQAVNPILPLFNLTQFNRLISPFIVTAIVIFSLLIVSINLKNKNRYLICIFLVFTFSQLGLLYHAGLVRSELYAIFYLVLSFWLLNTKFKYRFFLTGVFLGLSLLTKIQSVFLILMIILYQFLKPKLVERYRPNHRYEQSLPLWINILCLIVFLMMTRLGLQTLIPEGYATFATPEQFKLNKFFYLFLIYLVLSSLISFFCFFIFSSKIIPISKFLFIKSKQNSFIALGILSSFLFHFAIGFDIEQSFEYLLYDFKIIFIRETYNQIPFLELIKLFFSRDILAEYYFSLLINLLLSVALSIKLFSTQKRFLICLLIGVDLLFFLHSSLGTRDIYRDFIWIEIPLNLMIILKVLTLINYHMFYRIFAVTFFLLSIITNIYRTNFLIPILNSEFNLYGWNVEKIFKPVYGDQWGYGKLINTRFMDKLAEQRMSNFLGDLNEVQNNACFVMSATHCNDQNISVLFPGAPATLGDRSFFRSIDPFLENSIIYRLSGDPNSVKFNFRKELIEQEIDVSGKIETDRSSAISILNRLDLEIYYFRKSDSSLRNNKLTAEVTTEKVSYFYSGKLLEAGTKIPVILIADGDFILIKNKNRIAP